jgi:hypothetical protein
MLSFQERQPANLGVVVNTELSALGVIGSGHVPKELFNKPL